MDPGHLGHQQCSLLTVNPQLMLKVNMRPRGSRVVLDHDGHRVDHETCELDIQRIQVSFQNGQHFVEEQGILHTANFCKRIADSDHFLGGCELEMFVFLDDGQVVGGQLGKDFFGLMLVLAGWLVIVGNCVEDAAEVL